MTAPSARDFIEVPGVGLLAIDDIRKVIVDPDDPSRLIIGFVDDTAVKVTGITLAQAKAALDAKFAENRVFKTEDVTARGT